ncbi:hypothetical protein HG536_0D00100 [Torulaspora globosa]|uniref:Helicase C-terminal domain-containing protein n=1 Tax=Torulaspora globosa TaxID=48254 RepID=A0A7G3ZG52_9SACH|nr:uncharacterized protein HG536_0D00100 [Torulaspora globosa]QLL32488.1 hypothetical protein HG536_0D00100 [Torulaspora globosa]
MKLGYIIIDEFHNLLSETYRSSRFKRMRNLNFDAFEKTLFFSATAPPDIAEGALHQIGFKGLERAPTSVEQVTDQVKITPKQPCANLVAEMPLGHIHKEFKSSDDPKLEAVKMLRGLFKRRPNSKAIVVVNEISLVEALASEWAPLFNLVWVHGNLSSEQKAARARSFMNDGSKELLIGTKLVTEGISIASLKMVIIINFSPNILEFIQMIGRLRESGLCFLLRGEGRYPSYNDPLLPAVKEACLAAQIRKFYNLELVPGSNPHSGCCEAFETLPVATQHLQGDVDIMADVVGTDGYVSRTSGGLTSANNNLPFRTADAKRFKSNYHGWEGFSEIFYFLGFRGYALSNLFLYGIDIHFCPWGVFTAYGKCKDCGACLCPRPDGTAETQGKSYRRIAIEVLAVRRMLLDDEQFEEHLKEIEPYYKDPFPYLTEFHKEVTLEMPIVWYLNLLSSKKPIRALESERGVRLSGVFSKTAREIYETYRCLWHRLSEQQINVAQLFFNFEWTALRQIWEHKDHTEELVECPEIEQIFGPHPFAKQR